jgi:type I restriction enzyme S subunit
MKYKLQTGDTIIQTVGSWPRNPNSVVGKVIKVPSKASGALLNQNAVKISPAKTLDRSFIFYLLKSNIFRDFIIGCAQGAANQASITLDDIRNFSFWLPPLPIQRKIAAFLSAYDDLIENNTQRIKILEEMAQALYHEWFVKFRFPGHEKVRMVGWELGKIPEGWEVKNLFEAAKVTYGFPFKSKLFTQEPLGKPVIRIRDINSQSSKTFTPEEPDDKYLLKNGDLLVRFRPKSGLSAY